MKRPGAGGETPERPEAQTILHASCVAVGPAAVLICGRSGSGKSALALELMSRGAVLVADDRTILTLRDGTALIASCPAPIRGRIEARGIGILAAQVVDGVSVALVIDLDGQETGRLPPVRQITLLGVTLPLLHGCVHGHFPAAVMQYLRGGRCD